ncbi:protein NRT1/ PTR FAMILY 5.2-like [Phalaenopsis equestris]|uniref:protein NRT1/ PTR FAMILY 5.2-like n=1 Tax=Phalaenopsis equestris TaxID=78828 RepID=UPI0009E5EBE3|nr:protein NRT1/ PTR FAMILY 5.2-like [Phalaenopsis equestris]
MADEERCSKRDEYTKDGTVDLKGRACRRAKGGRWAACSFVLVSEALERLAYYGIASNLILYLTDVLHQGTVTSSNNVTNWMGTVMMTPILAAFIADAYLGRYWTCIISFVIYFLGMSLLILTASLPALRPPPCHSSKDEGCKNLTQRFQITLFYSALYTIAFGVAGSKANCVALGAEQFDNFEPKERAQKMSFFNWRAFAISLGNLFATIVLIYIESNVSWLLGYAIAGAALAISILVFILGTPLYRHKVPSGSPFTRIAQVLVAATRKWRVPLPDQDSINDLHELDSELHLKQNKSRNNQTIFSSILKFFDKAAVKTNSSSSSSSSDSPWMFCPFSQVEETKQIIRLFPMFIITIMPSVMVAQVLTLFIKQGTTLDQNLTGLHFKLPPANLSAVFVLSILVGAAAYDRFFVPVARKHTNNPRGLTFLQRIGIGLAMHIIIMLGTSLVERWRLGRARSLQPPPNILILLPQFALMGIAEVFVAVGKMEFFYDQAPESMKSLGASFFTSSFGIGNFISTFLLTTVTKITARDGGKGWVQDNLNSSHLDYYYAFLAGLNAINLMLFLIVSKNYDYRSDDANSALDQDKQGS